MVCSPQHLAFAVTRSSPPRYDHNVCVHGTTSNCSFISGVKYPLNASKTSVPKFLRSTPGLLLHTTNQSFRSSLLVQNSGWVFQLLLPSPLYVLPKQWTSLLHWNYKFCQHTYHHLFKFFITTSPPPGSIQNTGHTCSPLLYVAWHFSGLTNDRTLTNQN
jgi:hypothetical protein